MKKITITKDALQKGETISLSDERNVLELYFFDAQQEWARGFKIRFNGEIIFSCKRFPTAKNRFIELFKEKNMDGKFLIPSKVKITALIDSQKFGSTVKIGKIFEADLLLPQGIVYFDDSNGQCWTFWVGDTCKLIS